MKASNDLILFEQLDQPEDRGTNEPPRAGERVPARIKIKIGGSGTGGGGREHIAVALYHPVKPGQETLWNTCATLWAPGSSYAQDV
jgi:hypothetical protein